MQELQEFFPARSKEIYLLNASQVDFYWEQIVEALQEVPGFYDFYDDAWAYHEAKMGLLQVWALSDGAIRGIVLTRMLVYPRQKVLEIMAMTGASMLEYFGELEDILDRFAAAGGCQSIAALARPGVARKARKHLGESKLIVISRPVGAMKRDS